MTSLGPMFEQLRDEFPGICVAESPTGRQRHYGIRFCGMRARGDKPGTCRFHAVPDAERGVYITARGRRLSRAEQELLLVLNQFKAGGPTPGALVQALVDSGWRRQDLPETDYSREL